jgi:sec-independent protein translocase protein TatA
MGTLSIWHWIILIAIAVILFGGRGKISDLMGDVAKGIKSFKRGLADDETKPDPKQLASQPPTPAPEPHKDETRTS